MSSKCDTCKFKKVAFKDMMTGLSNRAFFNEVARCWNVSATITVFVIDIDGLKQINDTKGHQAGDDFIITAARVLRRVFSDGDGRDVLARIGGDEFAVITPGLKDGQTRARLLETEFEDNGIPASVGVADGDAEDWEKVFATADSNMYVKKRARKGEL